MATFEEVEAGLKLLNEKIVEHVPGMFQSRFTEEARLSLVTGILEAAEKARNDAIRTQPDEPPAA